MKDVDLHGKTSLVTGSNCGVGLETSRQLLDLSASKLILAVRNEEKGRAAAADLLAGRENVPPDKIEVWKLDLSVHDSVVAFADRVAKAVTRLDIAILNAGFIPVKCTVNTSTSHDEIGNNQPEPTHITLTLSEVAAWAQFPVGKEVPILTALDAPGKLADDANDRMLVSKLLSDYFVHELAKKVPPSVAIINGLTRNSLFSVFFSLFSNSISGLTQNRFRALVMTLSSIARPIRRLQGR